MTKKVESLQQLEQAYGPVVERALWKEIDHLNGHYQQFIEHSPFLVLATHGEKGVDCSPRGDPAGFVRVVDATCIQIPDRRGNNRLDSLRNIVTNPSVGIIFFVPGSGETVRVSGQAEILLDEVLRASFAIDGKAASSVISIRIEKAYFQCQKAIARSGLWDSTGWGDKDAVPSAGQMAKVFADAKGLEFDAEEYDRNYPEHMKKTIY
ncbi:MAG: pyridoxamine 5'-phosphate oxidase family protein [Halioglobus sp.]